MGGYAQICTFFEGSRLGFSNKPLRTPTRGDLILYN